MAISSRCPGRGQKDTESAPCNLAPSHGLDQRGGMQVPPRPAWGVATVIEGLFGAFAAVVLGLMLRRDQHRARRHRDELFDDCLGLLETPRLVPEPAGPPRLIGHHRGYRVTLRVVSEALAPRKLPSLWLFVELQAERPDLALLDMLLRPVGVEFWSPADLSYRLKAPEGWPETVVIRTDDPARVPSLEALSRTGALLHDRRAKEITLGPRGVRIVWQASEGARGEYLLLRQARFDLQRIDPRTVLRLLEHAMELAAVPGTSGQLPAARNLQSPQRGISVKTEDAAAPT